MDFETKLSAQEEERFQVWKKKYAPKDSGVDYDLRGAFREGLTPDPVSGHWPDTFKKPNHPTFSDQSKYAKFGKPGSWQGETYIPYKEPGMAEDLNDKMPFGDAFRSAKKAGLQEFSWRGRKFSTQTAGEAATPSYQPPLVPGIQTPTVPQQAGPSMTQQPQAMQQPMAQMPEVPAMDLAATQMNPAWMVGPPKTPEERADRVSGWQEFFGKIQSDPRIMMAMLKFGTQLMQPIQPGQSVGGHFGQAVGGTVDYMANMNMALEKQKTEGMRAQADIEQSQAATEASRTQMEIAKAAEKRTAAAEPLRLSVLQKQLDAAKTQEDINKLKLQMEQFNADPKRMDQKWRKEMMELDLRMKGDEARIAASNAAAEHYRQAGQSLTAAERKAKIEEDASIAYVNEIDQAIAEFARDEGARKGKVIPFSIAAEDFFAGYPTLKDHYFKYKALAVKARREAGDSGKLPELGGATPPVGGASNPSAKDTLQGQTPEQVKERTRGSPNITVIRGPDGKLKIVPVGKTTPGNPSGTPEPLDVPQY